MEIGVWHNQIFSLLHVHYKKIDYSSSTDTWESVVDLSSGDYDLSVPEVQSLLAHLKQAPHCHP